MTADSSGPVGEGGAGLTEGVTIQEDAHSNDYFAGSYSPELARLEACLDEHQEFFQDYLIRKGSRRMIDAWLTAHAGGLPREEGDCNVVSTTRVSLGTFGEALSQTALGAMGLGEPGAMGSAIRSLSTGSKSTGSGGSETPVRKISAHDFEKGGLNKPIVQTIDGTPTFLSPPPCASELTGQIRKKSRTDLQTLDEGELILELVKDISNDLDVKSLCHKILQNVGILTDADRCSLFLVVGEPGTDSQYLVSNLFDVNSNSTVEEMSTREIRVPWGVGIVGHVAKTGESCNVEDCYQDSRFNKEVDEKTGYCTSTMMCSPIMDAAGDVIGVSQVINKNNKNGNNRFSSNDEKVFEKYLQFCGIGLRNAQLYERSQLEVKRNQVLLDLAGVIFQEQSTLEHMIHRILTHLMCLIQCQRAMVLLVAEGSQSTFSRVFDLDRKDLNDDELQQDKKPPQLGRFPINAGITSYVATTGERVSITNAYEDSRFDRCVDMGTDFRHGTVLAMPIKHAGSPGRIIGVFQLINKFENLPFTSNDENFVEAFAIFCGMGIQNVKMYEEAKVALAKQQVTLDVLSYHCIAPIEEAVQLSRQKVPSASALQLHSFQFDDFGLEEIVTLKASIRMFIDLDLVNPFNIDYLTLCRWLCSVKRNYRSVTYHNWRHAHNVCQLMFSILTNTQWWRKFGEIECLALVIACLCHDLDHRGTNNSFQQKASNSLWKLYSSSTMEHHHFNQCLMLLNTSGCKILSNLSQEQFKEVLNVIEDSVLATDLAIYFNRRDETFKLLKSGDLDWSLPKHKSLLRGLLMTACDLGAITKPWKIQQKVAQKIADEFFFQGDLERQDLHLTPERHLDRANSQQFPAMQVDYIDYVCMPVYDNLALFTDHLAPLLEGCQSNREHWNSMIEQKEEDKPTEGATS